MKTLYRGKRRGESPGGGYPAILFLVVSALLSVVIGCEEEPLPEIEISSMAFHHEGTIPNRHTCKGEGLSVPLSFGEGPEGTVEYAITMIEEVTSGEEDSVTSTPHWVVWGVSHQSRRLGEGLSGDFEPKPGVFQGLNFKENHGYAPPCPDDDVQGRYVFRVYALDEPVVLGEDAGLADLKNAIGASTVGEGELVGYFEKP